MNRKVSELGWPEEALLGTAALSAPAPRKRPLGDRVAMENRWIKVIVADDNSATLDAVTKFLRGEEYSVISMVGDGLALVRDALEKEADIAVVDMIMPGMNGIEATARLRDKGCSIRVVLLTAHREPEFVTAALAAGAYGFVLKHRLVLDLPKAIDAALDGQTFLSPSLENLPSSLRSR